MKRASSWSREFNSLKGNTARPFGGLVWYKGHHDLDPIKYPDPASYGWIMELRNQKDGVYGKVNWTPEGEKLKTDGSFKYFSPAFDGLSDAGILQNGRAVVRPAFLRSVAFTNNPNMPVLPLANERLGGRFASGAYLGDEMLDQAGLMNEAERNRWHAWMDVDFARAAIALGNAGTREGALKGWETRRAGMAAKNPAKVAAKVAAKTAKGGRKKMSNMEKQDRINEIGERPKTVAELKERQSLERSLKASAKANDRARVAAFTSKSPEEQDRIVADRVAKSNADISNTDRYQPKPGDDHETPSAAAVSVAAKTGKGGFFSKVINAFKKPSAHSGDAFGN